MSILVPPGVPVLLFRPGFQMAVLLWLHMLFIPAKRQPGRGKVVGVQVVHEATVSLGTAGEPHAALARPPSPTRAPGMLLS